MHVHVKFSEGSVDPTQELQNSRLRGGRSGGAWLEILREKTRTGPNKSCARPHLRREPHESAYTLRLNLDFNGGFGTLPNPAPRIGQRGLSVSTGRNHSEWLLAWGLGLRRSNSGCRRELLRHNYGGRLRSVPRSIRRARLWHGLPVDACRCSNLLFTTSP